MQDLKNGAKENLNNQGLSNYSEAHKSTKWAFLMSLGTLVSRVLGLLRESLFAALFPRWVTDAWYVAFRLPNIFRRLLGEGSLSVSFIPVFIEVLNLDLEKSKDFVRGFFILFSIFLLTLMGLGIVFMEPLLKLLLDATYVSQIEKFSLTLKMSQIMFVYIYLVCIYALAMSILNALGEFGKPALAPAFFNIVVVVSTLIPTSILDWSGQALAWGVVIGGLVQIGVLLPSLFKKGYLSFGSFFNSNVYILKVLKGMLPSMLGMGLMQIMTLVNLSFSSQLGEGSISYINFADRILELPLSLISVSLGAALLPSLSRLWINQDRRGFSELSFYHMKLNLYLCIPASIGIYILSIPIVELLFQYGKFSYQETLKTAEVLQVYAFLLLSTSLVRVFVPNFYAIKNTWYPALVSLICLLIHLVLAPYLISTMNLLGLNLSTLIASFLNITFLAIGYHFLVGSYPWLKLVRSCLHYLVPASFMGLILHLYPFLRHSLESGFLGRLMSLFLVIALGVFIYFFLSFVLRFQEFTDIFQRFNRRFRK